MQGTTIEDPIHFVGIGGSGMSGLAELAIHGGHKVQGSDAKASAAVDRLVRLGALVVAGHDANALGTARTVVYSSAIPGSNVELVEARRLGLAVLHRSDFLRHLMEGRQAVTVAGTHGKTTTSAMITHMLDDLGLDPSAAIGGAMQRYHSPARSGGGGLFVAEADESDGSFLKYQPFVGVLTNVAFDHMEYFKDQTRLETAFRSYLRLVDPDGWAIVGWDSALARQVAEGYAGNRLTYGFVLGSEVRATEYHCDKGETRFTAIVERDRINCRLAMMGRHNVQNALCCLAVARALELDCQKAAASLAHFAGVERRMTHVHSGQALHVFDDYAHNPGKIAASVETLREAWPDWQLHVVFQPHRYTRLETMYDDMLDAMLGADIVYLVPVYSAGETTLRDFSPTRLARDLEHRLPVEAVPCESLDEAVQAIRQRLAPNSVVLTVGAGDVHRVATQLEESLA